MRGGGEGGEGDDEKAGARWIHGGEVFAFYLTINLPELTQFNKQSLT